MSPQPRSILALGVTTAAALAVGLATEGRGQSATKSAPTTDPSAINRPFAKADAKEYVKKFESESREVYQARGAIVGAMGLKPGMDVADLGAGTGLFTRLIADAVGPSGRVYAVDVSEPFLKHIEEQAKASGRSQIRTVRASQEATNLKPGSVDLVFVCDVYHHLEHPSKTLASVRQALRPGGALVLVEFDREASEDGFVRKHVRAGKAAFLDEIRAAGFKPVDSPAPPTLKENFFQRFVKGGDAPALKGPATR